MINIRETIPRGLREQVTSEFKKRLSDLSDSEISEVEQKVFKKMQLISNSHQSWVRDVALHVRVLYVMIKLDIVDSIESIENMEKFQLTIYTALHYFIDDFDLIPDHSLHDGFLDDALMINHCINRLPKAQKERFEKFYKAAS